MASAEWRLKIKAMGREEPFEVGIQGPGTLVRELKQHIAQQHPEMEMDRQRLIFRGKVLTDDQTLSSYSITDGAVLHLVLRPAGARPAPNPEPPAAQQPQPAFGQAPPFHFAFNILQQVLGGVGPPGSPVQQPPRAASRAPRGAAPPSSPPPARSGVASGSFPLPNVLGMSSNGSLEDIRRGINDSFELLATRARSDDRGAAIERRDVEGVVRLGRIVSRYLRYLGRSLDEALDDLDGHSGMTNANDRDDLQHFMSHVSSSMLRSSQWLANYARTLQSVELGQHPEQIRVHENVHSDANVQVQVHAFDSDGQQSAAALQQVAMQVANQISQSFQGNVQPAPAPSSAPAPAPAPSPASSSGAVPANPINAMMSLLNQARNSPTGSGVSAMESFASLSNQLFPEQSGEPADDEDSPSLVQNLVHTALNNLELPEMITMMSGNWAALDRLRPEFRECVLEALEDDTSVSSRGDLGDEMAASLAVTISEENIPEQVWTRLRSTRNNDVWDDENALQDATLQTLRPYCFDAVTLLSSPDSNADQTPFHQQFRTLIVQGFGAWIEAMTEFFTDGIASVRILIAGSFQSYFDTVPQLQMMAPVGSNMLVQMAMRAHQEYLQSQAQVSPSDSVLSVLPPSERMEWERTIQRDVQRQQSLVDDAPLSEAYQTGTTLGKRPKRPNSNH